MKTHYLSLLLVSLLWCSFSAAGRTGSINGTVTDQAGKPLTFASVLLMNETDSAVIRTELTDETGAFRLSPTLEGDYRIRVVYSGYDVVNSGIVHLSSAPVSLPEIRLEQHATTLKDVTLTMQKPFVEVHADKLVVNVENSIVSAGSSVMEVLQQSPGVKVDQNDNISLKGKPGVNVMIDGRTLPVSAQDLANMLKSMPAGSVDKIELISNPLAKYDAAGTGGIINIKTKKDSRMGINGSVNGSYGQGIYPKETGGFNINYRQKKLSMYANYNANYRDGFSHVNWVRAYYDGHTFTSAFVQNNSMRLFFRTNMATAGIDYKLSPKTTIGGSVTGEDFNLGTKGYYHATVLDADRQEQSFFATTNSSAGNWKNYAPNIHLKHTFDSTGEEVTVDADYARYWNTNKQDFTTRYYALNGDETHIPYMLHGDVTGLTQIRSLKTDYTEPLKNGARLEAGFKVSYVTADNEPNFYDRSNGGNEYDSGKSNHFLYSEQISALYLNGSRDWKKWSTQLGLRVEQTILEGHELVSDQEFKNTYTQLFPSLAVQNHIDKNNDLGVTLSRRIERASYDDLNPYKFYVDPTTYKAGNPYLKPALTYAAELSHAWKQRLITTLAYSTTTNVITEVIKPSTTQEKVTIQTKDNLATMEFIGLGGAYTLPISKWWTNVTNFNAYYARYEGDISNTHLNEGKPMFDINTSTKFTLPNDWSAEVTFFYQAAQVYGFLNLTAISTLNAGIQKNLLNKKLTIKVNANDIFYNGNLNGSSYFTNYTEVFTAKHDTRQANVAVTWRFGKKDALVRKHNGGAEEEKMRANQKAG